MCAQVEKTVRIKALSIKRDIGQCKIQGKQDNNWNDVEERYRFSPREKYLEESVCRIERMLRRIGPQCEGGWEAARSEDTPVDGYQSSVLVRKDCMKLNRKVTGNLNAHRPLCK